MTGQQIHAELAARGIRIFIEDQPDGFGHFGWESKG